MENTLPNLWKSDIIVVDWHNHYLDRRRKPVRDAKEFMDNTLLEWARENCRVFEILEIDRHLLLDDPGFLKTGQSRMGFLSSQIPPELVTDRFFKMGQTPNETFSSDGRKIYSVVKFRQWLKMNKLSQCVIVAGLFLDQCVFQTVSVLSSLGYRCLVLNQGCIVSPRLQRKKKAVVEMISLIAPYRNFGPGVVNWPTSDNSKDAKTK